ncbi:uncharacterized protein PHACADRAFT_30808 [Phanerochaete carnosa HHB-10118-sp]|uniref:DNA-directed DNA polymerase n=1 Tax=Phanerochaete carnosa (strain HHB-10118-sp) TaxID=650164 RepID=K5VLI0_PHACS|nr:uncharacterized protein PHACADRAFT_30808 [Phanerochaete carnosa HHB-10118-sp]EKM52273.1 hypothetical protein PHACADRAFT_30808 [Phanerochaete carnosa HHB-10118-sp]
MSQLYKLRLSLLIPRNPNLGHAVGERFEGTVSIQYLLSLRAIHGPFWPRDTDSPKCESLPRRSGALIRPGRGRDPRHLLELAPRPLCLFARGYHSHSPPHIFEKMDCDAATNFFVEQDDRMNAPDETEEEFAARVGDRRSAQGSSSVRTGQHSSDHRTKTPRDATISAMRHSMCVRQKPKASPLSAYAGEDTIGQDAYMSNPEECIHSGKRKSPDQASRESGAPEKKRRQQSLTNLTAASRNVYNPACNSVQTDSPGTCHTRSFDKGPKAGKLIVYEEPNDDQVGRSSKLVDGGMSSLSASPIIMQQHESHQSDLDPNFIPAVVTSASGLSQECSPQHRQAVSQQIRAYHSPPPDIQAATLDEPSAQRSSLIRATSFEDGVAAPSSSAVKSEFERGNSGRARTPGNARARNGSPSCTAAAVSPSSGDTTTAASTQNANEQPPPSFPPRTKTTSRKKKVNDEQPPSGAHVEESAAKPKKRPLREQKEMSPAEFAAYISQVTSLNAPKKAKNTTFLKGMRIYYVGCDTDKAGERTRTKMQRLVAFGATLMPTYDPAEIEIIITEPKLTQEQFCAKHGLQSVKDVPAHIPILKTSWVTSGEERPRLDRWERHPSYKDHVVKQPDPAEANRAPVLRPTTASQDKLKANGAANRDRKNEAKVRKQRLANSDESDFDSERQSTRCASQFTEGHADKEKAAVSAEAQPDLPPKQGCLSGSSFGAAGSGGPSAEGESSRIPVPPGADSSEDPLAQYYGVARAEQEEELEGYFEVEPPVILGGQRSHFQCDNVPDYRPKLGECPNQDIIDIFTQLKEIYEIRKAESDNFRADTYRKVIKSLREYPKRIESREELVQINGAGKKTKDKIMEIIKTGRLRRLQFEMTAELDVLRLFQGIYGVGSITSLKWYAAGCRTLDDIHQRKGGIKLSDAQELGLKYYDDINSRISRQEVGEIFQRIKDIAHGIDKKLIVEIMGSYRRGKADCGDIDILITRPTDDKKHHKGLAQRMVNLCQMHGIIVDHLSIPSNWWSTELVYHGLCRRDDDSPVRRLDFLAVPYEQRGAALLYFTGDDIVSVLLIQLHAQFNRSMRAKANKMDYSLNQRGLYDMVVRNSSKRSEKLSEGALLRTSFTMVRC